MDGDGIVNTYEIFNETDKNLDNETDKLYSLLDFALKREKLENVEFNIANSVWIKDGTARPTVVGDVTVL